MLEKRADVLPELSRAFLTEAPSVVGTTSRFHSFQCGFVRDLEIDNPRLIDALGAEECIEKRGLLYRAWEAVQDKPIGAIVLGHPSGQERIKSRVLDQRPGPVF